MKTRFWIVPLIIAFVLSTFALPVYAEGSVTVAVSHSIVVNMPSVWRVAVANPEIADVVVVSGSELLVIGKMPGITTLHTWSAKGRDSFEIQVGANDSMIANNIKEILGYSNVKVSKVNKTVILEGTVNDQYQKNRAEKVAGAYGEKVVNLLELTNPKQVKIEAKILEISKDDLDNLGIKWGNNPATNPGIFWAGQSAVQSIPSQRDVFGWFGSYDDLNALIDALIRNGHAKILSQPNIVTVSGEKANILVGGEIPIPVSFNNNQITIVWKEYGIKLAISPEVNGEGLIASSVKAEVSSIDYTNPKAMVDLGNGLVIPALKTRKAETAITMPSGKTMAIGGLISSDESKYITRFPFLSDIPILGKFFTSDSTTKNTREILILMTPTLIDPSEYAPAMTPGMKGFAADNPWREGKNGENGKDKANGDK